jgi:hypothetical protein
MKSIKDVPVNFVKPAAAPFVPAPWTLTGEAWVVPQLQRVDAVAAYVPPGCAIVAWRGWTLGGYVCVDYHTSPVGPYREIIFVPALVRRGWRWGFHISHIYVDSAASVGGGRGNWWLPKDLLTFAITKHENTTLFRADHEAQSIAWGVFTHNKLISLPFNNRQLPLHLLQAHADRVRRSAFWATGRIGVANGALDLLDTTRLPQLSFVVRLPLLHVQQFKLCFEVGQNVATFK